MRAVLVVNPQATSTTRGGRDVLAHALASRLKLDVAQTRCRGHAMALARDAARDGIDLVVAHGGDGTVNEVVNGLLADYGTDPARLAAAPMLAVVPGGSANVFARALGVPADPVEATHQLLEALEHGRSRTVGLGRAGGLWFTFNAGMGWDADVVAAVARRRGKRTSPGLYVRAALSCYLRPPLGRPPMTVHLPDGSPDPGGSDGGAGDPHPARTVFVSNTDPWSYLGERPVHLNRECSFDRGLGLFALSGLSLPTVARHGRRALSTRGEQRGRRLLRDDSVQTVCVTAEDAVNLQVDGDLIGRRRRVEFRSVADALTVVV